MLLHKEMPLLVWFVSSFLLLFSSWGSFTAVVHAQPNDDDELGAAAALFAGPIEVVAEHDDFGWLESPLWSDEGNFLLFSDVKWENEENITCGMIWKWDETAQELIPFIPCSGLIGPGETPANIADYVEGGSNGLYWGWKGSSGNDLLVCQHGKHRIVRVNLDNVTEEGEIDPDLVTVLADSYEGNMFNAPNDMTMVGDTLYFTDPPFGLQYFSAEDPIANAFANTNQAIGVYKIEGDPGANNTPVEPERILDFGNPDPWHAPNGIAVTPQGDLFIPITQFTDPRFHLYPSNDMTNPIRLESEYRIQGNNSDSMPPLNDGVSFAPEYNLIFACGPGGIYIYNATALTNDNDDDGLLGFLRLDNLVANNVIGGGYLWMTVNTQLMRIPLVSPSSWLSSSTTTSANGGTGMDGEGNGNGDDTSAANSATTVIMGLLSALSLFVIIW